MNEEEVIHREMNPLPEKTFQRKPFMWRDKTYLMTLLRLALPIMAQNLISASLNVVGVVMIGQMNETAVAAVGLANQVYFLLSFVLFGIGSGAGIFTAQYWGNQDVPNIRKVLGICLGMGLTGSLVFMVGALVFPTTVMGIYTRDPAVIALGAEYLRIIGWSYLVTAATFAFAAVLRSTGNVRLPMIVSAVSLSLDTLLNYGLIFGHFGLPQMGVRGAALGTCLARIFECGVLVLMTYRGKYPAAASLRELLSASRGFVRKFLVTALPVAANETLWGLGVSVYNMIYAHISTDAIAAINISSTIENLSFVVFIGICNASAIMIGGRIGAGEEHKAFVYARRALFLAAGGAILVGVAIILGADLILSLYKVSEMVRQYAHNIMRVLASVLWIRVSNMTIVVGILRSGGDTRFSMFLDAGTVWLIGIPLALTGAFLLHLPVYWVYLMVMTEEVAKLMIGLRRFTSKKWINNLVRTTG